MKERVWNMFMVNCCWFSVSRSVHPLVVLFNFYFRFNCFRTKEDNRSEVNIELVFGFV